MPVLSWLTLAVLLWLEAFAIRTASSTLALLVVADALALCYALSIQGQLFTPADTLEPPAFTAPGTAAIIDAAPILTEPSGSVARLAVPVR